MRDSRFNDRRSHYARSSPVCPGRDAALLRCFAEPGPRLSKQAGPAALQRTASQELRAALRPGHENSAAIQRGGHPLRNMAFREKAERRALNSGRLAFTLRNGDQKVAAA